MQALAYASLPQLTAFRKPEGGAERRRRFVLFAKSFSWVQPKSSFGNARSLLLLASAGDDATSSLDTAETVTIKKWVLEPVGDGDCRHLDIAVPLPDAFELSSTSATVGRVADKADIVIPVGTVSGLHARLEKKGEMLLVTDLDSTNGTYVNNKRVRPGAVTQVSPGTFITFGDEHLAQFKFTIVEQAQEN